MSSRLSAWPAGRDDNSADAIATPEELALLGTTAGVSMTDGRIELQRTPLRFFAQWSATDFVSSRTAPSVVELARYSGAVTPTDTSANFAGPNMTGTATLQTRTFTGAAGTAAITTSATAS